MYNTAYRGIYNHHLVEEESYKELYGLPKEKSIMAPQQCCLDKNNIKYEKVILKAYKKNIHKYIFACLSSIHNTISLSCHEQVCLSGQTYLFMT